MAPSGINKQVIARMMRDIQREFDKHPIRVPLEADAPRVLPLPTTAAGNIYNSPVIYGSADGAGMEQPDGRSDPGPARNRSLRGSSSSHKQS